MLNLIKLLKRLINQLKKKRFLDSFLIFILLNSTRIVYVIFIIYFYICNCYALFIYVVIIEIDISLLLYILFYLLIYFFTV